jgi:PrtD family type I secretion system ABC transporter
MIAASILLGRALSPVEQAIAAWKTLISARSSYERLNALLAKFPERPATMSLPAPEGKLMVEGASVVAPNSQLMILKGVSFALQPGEAVAVIGPSASGKSTLARILVGVWRTVSGKVRLDGADVFAWDKSELGQYIGYLPQDIELFAGTIAENISRFGEMDSAKVVKAAELAGVHEMILRLPQGYDTAIGEAGGFLSGGQRQRIALARAMYGDPVLVVLDEPNSNLDDQGEMALAQALQNLKSAGCAIVVITHRTNIVATVDKILVLREGTVQLFGSKSEVLAALNKQAQAQVAAISHDKGD